jgi:hypothetical protein
MQPGTGMSKADYLAASIAENKFDLEHAIPVIKVTDGRYIQVGGHHRAEALRHLGYTQVPVVYNPKQVFSSEAASVFLSVQQLW